MRPSARLGLALGVALAANCREAPEPAWRQSVVLITVDTLRADHLGAYGDENAHTPNIDALAKSGVLFEKALSPVPVTLPSHASILTGLFPPTHGVRDNTYFRLDDDALTLAEILDSEGYQTGAFVGAFVLDGSFGLDQGFDVYDDDMDDSSAGAPGSFAERRGEKVQKAFSTWLEKASPDEPLFAWLHFFDPHLPYRGSYDDEIAYTDQQIGAVVAKLSERGLLDKTLIVLTADHGESLGEHGEKSHGFFVYDATLHVPLILASPRAVPRGRRIPSPVSTVDIFPTVLDTLGLPIPETVQGQSLLPRLDDPGGETGTPLYAECYVPELNFGWAPLVTLRRGGYKYIHAPEPELYDLEADPEELHNLYEDDPRRAREMREALSSLLSRWPQSLSSRRQPDAETFERLRSLGYTGSGGGSVGNGLGDLRKLPDPKDRLHLWSRLEELILLQSAGDRDAVIDGAHAVLAEDPQNLLALELLAGAHSKAGRTEEALAVYEKILEIDDSRPLSYLRYGNLLWRAGRLEAAEAAFDAAIEKDSGFARAYRRLGELYLTTGRSGAAKKAFESALAIEDSTEGRLGLARSLTANESPERALEELARLYRDNPEDPAVLAEYAGTLAKSGQVERAITLLRQGPDQADVHYTLSVLYRSTGRMDEALTELEKAVKERPDFAAAENDRGVLLSRAGRLEEAVAALRKALALKETPTTENALGTALCRLERCGEGIPHFEAALRAAPEFLEALENLAQAYSVVGREADAERTARRAEEIRSKR